MHRRAYETNGRNDRQMTDPAKQKEATVALDQSRAAMKAGNDAECMKHMNVAHKAMGM